MTTTVASIVDRVGFALNDAAHVRWPAAEILEYVNDGQREVVNFKPEAYTVTAPLLLTASSTRQSLPADAVALLDVVRNLGADGLTPGRSINVTSRDVVSSLTPAWHSTANTYGYVEQFMYDPRTPKAFFTYPMAPATPHYVEVVYSAIPAASVLGGNLVLDDIYANAILAYVLFRCLSKDATNAQNVTNAGAYYQMFTNSIVGKAKVEVAWNPNHLGTNAANPGVPVRSVPGAM